MPILSIIIPVYNSEKYLYQCISSLYRQGLKIDEFEVLLIDDGSKDDSLSKAKTWGTRHKNIRVFHQENQGQAVARNLGIDNSKGDYLMFVDSDDYILDAALLPLINQISNKDLDCLGFGIEFENSSGKIINSIKHIPSGEIYSGEHAVLNFDVIGSVCTYIFKANILKGNKIRFKRGFVHEDAEFCFRIFPLIKTFCYSNNIAYHYRYNPTSTDRSSDIDSIIKRVNSDLIIACEIKKHISKGDFGESIASHYNKISNSLIVSHYLSFHKLKHSHQIKSSYFSFVKNFDCFPIKGRCGSFRSTVFSKFINLHILILRVIHAFKN
ncbi:MAG: glycosyltransferase [Clostridium sp.]|nr:glycosyltransferase [Clostridium sp.]